MNHLKHFIEEDVYGSYARIVTKYFLAEGALKQNYLLSASMNESSWDLVSLLLKKNILFIKN